ncbi:MAG: hypothetical protein QF406_10645, partial [Verrucomicrobiota bacterium]|nr:hypothetical protein [Verrucomicrobiota bacterium]
VEPAPVKAKTSVAEKLTKVLDHLEKIILVIVLVAVAAISVMKFLSVKKDSEELAKVDFEIRLAGKILANEGPTNLVELLKRSKEKPDAISLKGTNHLVFNPRKWKEITLLDTREKIIVIDSPSEPLGVSALKVEAIRSLSTRITPKAFVGSANTIRYEFALNDSEFPERDLWQRPPLNTFFQTTNFPPEFTSVIKRGWLPNPKKEPQPIHGFTSRQATYYLRQHPEWEIKVGFKAASPAGAADINQALARQDRMVPNVIFDLDIVFGKVGGGYVTNSVRQVSGAEIKEVRGYEADFSYKTKYTSQPIQLRRFREGRRFVIDGEVFRIISILEDKVMLISDLQFGGNGKMYDKKMP